MNYSPNVSERLNLQALEYFDDSLIELAQKSTRCLEIGCGVGSNLPVLRHLNANIDYVGIDISDYAIQQAISAHQQDAKTSFKVMNCQSAEFPDRSFDLIISKLVLWSVGPGWQQIPKAISRLLKPGGTLYCFEPDDSMLIFHPKKPAIENLIKLWQKTVTAHGRNPFIGRQLYSALIGAGFENVQTKIFHKTSTGNYPASYRKHAANLKKIFMSRGPSYLGLEENDPLWINAEKEFAKINAADFLVETHVIAYGQAHQR